MVSRAMNDLCLMNHSDKQSTRSSLLVARQTAPAWLAKHTVGQWVDDAPTRKVLASAGLTSTKRRHSALTAQGRAGLAPLPAAFSAACHELVRAVGRSANVP